MESRRLLSVVVAVPGTAPHCEILSSLRQNPVASVVGEPANLHDAALFLGAHSVDLLIVDVDLPGGGAFALLGALGSDRRPAVIFAAGDDSQALEAFRYQPLDFLLYSASRERVDDALARASDALFLRMIGRGEGGIQDLFLRARQGVHPALRLMVKNAGRISFVKAEDIDWVEADRDYVRLHNAGKKHLLRQKISSLEQQLPQGRFLRIHRSTIVNIDRIKELQPLSFGEYSVILFDGTRLTMSRSFRDRVFERLQSAA